MNKINSNNKETALAKEKQKTVLKRYLMIAITVAIVCVAMVPVVAESDAEKAIKKMPRRLSRTCQTSSSASSEPSALSLQVGALFRSV